MNDWRNLGTKLKSHEIGHERTSNMSRWDELENTLRNNETFDKNIQENIKKEKEHWKKLLLRIIAVVKHFAKCNLEFSGKK